MQRPITGEGVSPDVTSNNRRCAPAVILMDFAMMKNAADLPDVSTIGSKRRFRRPTATLHGVVFDIFGGSRRDPA
jgi:hypothetical protein